MNLDIYHDILIYTMANHYYICIIVSTYFLTKHFNETYEQKINN